MKQNNQNFINKTQTIIEQFINKHLVLIIGLIIAFTLINWGLSWGLNRVYHPDEPAMLRPILSTFVDFGWDMSDWTNTQPMFHVFLMSLLYKIFYGKQAIITLIQNADQSTMFLIGRKITTFFGLGTIIAGYYAAKRLYSQKIANYTAILLSITPILIWNSHYLYNDIPLTFWSTVTLAFSAVILTQKKQKLTIYTLAIFSAVFAATTKLTGFYILGLPILAHVLHKISTSNLEEENQKKTLPKKAKAVFKSISKDKYTYVLLASLMIIPLLVSPNLIDLAQNYHTKFFEPSQNDINQEMITFKAHQFILTPIIYTIGISLQFIIGWPLWIGFILASIILCIRKQKEELLLLLFVFPFLIIVSITWMKIYFRYLLPLIPAIIIMISAGYAQIKEKINKKKFKHQHSKQNIIKTIQIIATIAVIITALFTVTTTARFSNDTRDSASTWIHYNIPFGANIAGQEGFTSVDSPRISEAQFNLMKTPKTIAKLQENDPTYIVTSTLADNEFTRYSKFPIDQKEDNPLKVQEYIKNQANYKVIKTFESRYLNKKYYTKLDPYFEGFYISPTITIYQKQE